MTFTLPALPYAFNALEPSIDAQTVEIHYTRHHNTYLTNLNAAIEKHPLLFEKNIETLLRELNQVPEDIRTAVRNNGGGYYNHIVYWNIMGPNRGGDPVGRLAESINKAFGSFAAFKQEFEKAALGRFGSGWAWLNRNAHGDLSLSSTPNQDSPLSDGLYPVLGVDVWEHAYYLKYQNRRAEYLSQWWNVVNWEEAERRFVSG